MIFDSSYILEQTSIKEIVRKLGVPLEIEENSYQECFFCGSESSLKINRVGYKCMSPACGKSGNLFQFLVDLHVCDSFKESLDLVRQLLDISSNHDFNYRSDLLEEIFEIYKRQDKELAREILSSRGLDGLDYINPYGFAPDHDVLQDRGIDIKDLKGLGLISSSGKEFFQNRIIFPIYNKEQKLVHLQGRSCTPDAKVRWLSTPSISKGKLLAAPISRYFYNIQALQDPKLKALVLSEGIPDTLSFVKLGLPAIGCFGVQVDFSYLIQQLENIQFLTCVFDNDRYSLGRENSGQYKSWNAVIPYLIRLQQSLPNLTILCVLIPESVGKDANDWIQSGLTKSQFFSYIQTQPELEQFCIQLANQKLLDYKHVFNAVKVKKQSKYIDQLRNLVTQVSGGGVEFILDYF